MICTPSDSTVPTTISPRKDFLYRVISTGGRNPVLYEARSLAALEMTTMEVLLWITAVLLRREILAMTACCIM